jgi:hypothetical protein
MNTLQMEIAVIEDCNFRQNIVVPNVSFGIIRYLDEKDKSNYDELHECDILKVTLSGYATEYEIKISRSDFKADLKKKHKHDSRFVKQIYYVVPFEMLNFAKEHVPEYAGLAFVKNGKVNYLNNAPIRKDCFKWSDKELFKLTRLGTMRIMNLKKALNKKIIY